MAGQGAQRHRTWVFAAAGVGVAAIIAVVIVVIIVNRSSHAPIAGGQPGAGVAGTPTAPADRTPAMVGGKQDTASGTTAPPSATASGSPAGSARGTGPSSASDTPSTGQGSSANQATPLDSLAVCTSANFDTRANACRKADSQVSAGNSGQTVDGDLSFPDYMTGTISLLQKKGTTWNRLGEFSTKTYPDVVVIDSNKFISVQLANVFSYGGHRALPGCSTDWGIEVDDAQGLPLGAVKFAYMCS